MDFDEDIALYAFRYCLGRMTYAVSTCVDYLLLHWDQLSDKAKGNIYREIREAEATDSLGMDMDKQQWMRVIERYEAAS